MDINDNPLECGFDKFVNTETEIEFLGKDKLIKIKNNGVQKKLMGVKIETKEISLYSSIELKNENNDKIGELRSACFSPLFDKVIGIAMINKPFFQSSQSFKIVINGVSLDGKVCDLPFI